MEVLFWGPQNYRILSIWGLQASPVIYDPPHFEFASCQGPWLGARHPDGTFDAPLPLPGRTGIIGGLMIPLGVTEGLREIIPKDEKASGKENGNLN